MDAERERKKEGSVGGEGREVGSRKVVVEEEVKGGKY